MLCRYFSYIYYVFRIHLVNISLILINHEPSTVYSKGLAYGRRFWTQTWWKIVIFQKIEKHSWDLRNIRTTYLDFWKSTGPSRASLYVIRRAVVFRVLRVQRRYIVRIRPMENITWAHFGQIFALFIERYIICISFSYMECVLRVKISLIFTKYESSTVRAQGLAHGHVFLT